MNTVVQMPDTKKAKPVAQKEDALTVLEKELLLPRRRQRNDGQQHQRGAGSRRKNDKRT